MLDLARPLPAVEGLTLYADHERDDVVYVLPDEIGLLESGGVPDLLLQVFYPDEAVTDDADLADAVGSILSLGVRCVVSPERLQRAQAALGDRVGLVVPPWEDGTVSLLLLDALGDAGSADPMVLSVAGTRRPSLSDGSLSALFHARLDRRGTALVAAALAGTAGSTTGVLYDLTFAGLRPEVQLRMSADLDSCAEAVRAGLGVQVYYVAADVEATFATMRENGVIDVEVLVPVADPEAQRLVDEAVRDFYDVLMRELFRPGLSPTDLAGLPVGRATVPTAPVRLSFAYSSGTRERHVSVDYRSRSGGRRTHNPNAHLRALGGLGAGHALVQRVPLSAAWREATVEIAAPQAFDAPPAGDPSLREVRAVLWRGADGVLLPEEAREGGLRMPPAALPLADLGLTKDDPGPRRRTWVSMPTEPPHYHWQARLTYQQQDGVDSPLQVWSPPAVSTSSDLDLFPAVLAPVRQVRLRLGAGHDASLDAVEADVAARDRTGAVVASRRLVVTAAEDRVSWQVRRAQEEQVTVEAAITYRYRGGRRVALPSRALVDSDLVANTPFATLVELTPLVGGAGPELAEVHLTATYEEEVTGFRTQATARLRAPEFTGDPVLVPVLRLGDTVRWSATAWLADGTALPVGTGASAGGVVPLRVGSERRVIVEWLGRSLEEEELRWVRVTVRARPADGDPVDRVVQWTEGAPTGPQEVRLPVGARADYQVERRRNDGVVRDPWRPVEGDLVPVLP